MGYARDDDSIWKTDGRKTERVHITHTHTKTKFKKVGPLRITKSTRVEIGCQATVDVSKGMPLPLKPTVIRFRPVVAIVSLARDQAVHCRLEPMIGNI